MIFPDNLYQQLEQRKGRGLYRQLMPESGLIDFCSNDYLGFAASNELKDLSIQLSKGSKNGSTGSRLISGNLAYTEDLESRIAAYHSAESALLFNSGYDANLGLISCIAQKQDLILYDELSHASIHDGLRLSYARHFKFRHNDVGHLKQLIEKYHTEVRNVFIVVESVYSMDGDSAPLAEIAALTDSKVFLIVDEAHGTGVFGEHGRGLCNETQTESACFARIITYGKAMGSHGAAIVGSSLLRNYLINYSRPFIYTTALPLKSICTIDAAYRILEGGRQQDVLRKKIALFRKLHEHVQHLIPSQSAIQCFILKGNEKTDRVAHTLQQEGFYVKAIKSPTVPEGQERIRICLHTYNSDDEIIALHKTLRYL